ncbi:hypothetical protein FC07_GL002536 [Loigolactobacillus bifermentans DSM 20003]|uniref:Uncharacterized protein n=1 Tax=Loigolactobacillus bifermentans DSM 20003 TaxID=1423726 RepID=A0A0R1H823_9LACO|nr:hypothetical protein FC07_GL002536 [Loigolactobacillus bifermentans DSM 20003]
MTTVGTDLINQAIVNNTKMQFLRVIGSSTVYTADQLATLDDATITGASHNQDGHVSNVTRKDKTTIATELVLDGSNVKADYQLNTILILATVDGKDHLFAALKANQAQYMNAYDGNEAVNLQVNCSFKIANTDHVDITVDSAGTLTVDDYNRLHDYTDKVGKDTGAAANSYTDSKVAAASSAAIAANIGEAAARSAADSVASASLAAEVKARAAADTTNSTAASSAAASLATQITNNKSTFNTYLSAANSSAASMAAAITANSTAANSAVAAEAAARTKADTTEVTARSAADASLASSVAANTSAIAATSTAAKSYAASAATSAAGVGTTAANSAAASAKAAVTAESTARNNAVVAETNARSSADAGLQSQITANKTAASNAQIAANNAQSTANGKVTAGASAIAANTDLNAVQTVGFYSSSAAVTPTLKNCPLATGTLGLTVLKLADIFQFLVEYSSGSRRTQFRELISGTWTAWQSFAQLEANQTFTGKQIFAQAPQTTLAKNTTPRAITQFDVGNGQKSPIVAVAGSDANGDAIVYGAGGGLTIVGAGEAALTYLNDVVGKTMPSNLTAVTSVQDETLIMASDSATRIITNFQNNDTAAKEFRLDTNGAFWAPGGVYSNNQAVATQQWVNTNMSNALALKADMYDSGEVTAGITLLNGGKWSGTDVAQVGRYRIVKVGKNYLITCTGSIMGFTVTHKAMFSLPANVPWPTSSFLNSFVQEIGDGGYHTANWTTYSGAAPTFGVDSLSESPTATMPFHFHFMWWAPNGWTP